MSNQEILGIFFIVEPYLINDYAQIMQALLWTNKNTQDIARKITDCEGLTQYHPSPFIISCKKKEKKTIY